LALLAGSSCPLHCEKLTVHVDTDAQSIATFRLEYRGLSTTEPTLRLPVGFDFYEHTGDGSTLMIQEIHVESQASPGVRLEPAFTERPVFNGTISFPEGTSGPLDLKLVYIVRKNFSLSAEEFLARWPKDDRALDFYNWYPTPACDEMEFRFFWPPGAKIYAAKTAVWTERALGAPPEPIKDVLGPVNPSEKSFDRGTWHSGNWQLLATDVEPQRKFHFEWDFGTHR
jgi:hypothetical protein